MSAGHAEAGHGHEADHGHEAGHDAGHGHAEHGHGPAKGIMKIVGAVRDFAAKCLEGVAEIGEQILDTGKDFFKFLGGMFTSSDHGHGGGHGADHGHGGHAAAAHH